MTLKKSIIDAWNDISCSYGNHTWVDYRCSYHDFYHLLFTRKCEHCGKIEASVKPFEHGENR